MKLLAAFLSAGLIMFAVYAFGAYNTILSFANTPEHIKRERILRKQCVRQYKDKDGWVRFSGCRLGER